MQNENPVPTPMYLGAQFEPTESHGDLRSGDPVSHGTLSSRDPILNVPFIEQIGLLLYISAHTRPDISVGVNTITKKSSNPEELHRTGAKRILRYLTRHQITHFI